MMKEGVVGSTETRNRVQGGECTSNYRNFNSMNIRKLVQQSHNYWQAERSFFNLEIANGSSQATHNDELGRITKSISVKFNDQNQQQGDAGTDDFNHQIQKKYATYGNNEASGNTWHSIDERPSSTQLSEVFPVYQPPLTSQCTKNPFNNNGNSCSGGMTSVGSQQMPSHRRIQSDSKVISEFSRQSSLHENTSSQTSKVNSSNKAGYQKTSTTQMKKMQVISFALSHVRKNLSTIQSDQFRNADNLSIIDLSFNKFREVPSEIKSCSNLRVLKMDNNLIKLLPAALFSQTRLEHLSMGNNLLFEVPDSIILAADSLKFLDISLNRIEDLSFLKHLVKLQSLHLNNNDFRLLPTSIARLSELQELSLDWFSYVQPSLGMKQSGNAGERVIQCLYQLLSSALPSEFVDFFDVVEKLTKKAHLILGERRQDRTGNQFDIKIIDSADFDKALSHKASEREEIGCLISILERDYSLIDAIDADNHTPLSLSILNERFFSAKTLISNGANVNLGGSKYGSCLNLATIKYQFYLVQDLLKRGANPNQTDLDGNTPLHYIMTIFHRDHAYSAKICDLLLSYGADPNAKNSDQWAPIHLLSRRGQLEALKYIFDYNSRLADPMTERGDYPVLGNGNSTLNPFQINIRGGKDKQTPLQIACTNCCYDLVGLLLQNGADIFARDACNRVALQMSMRDNFLYKLLKLKETEIFHSVFKPVKEIQSQGLHSEGRRGIPSYEVLAFQSDKEQNLKQSHLKNSSVITTVNQKPKEQQSQSVGKKNNNSLKSSIIHLDDSVEIEDDEDFAIETHPALTRNNLPNFKSLEINQNSKNTVLQAYNDPNSQPTQNKGKGQLERNALLLSKQKINHGEEESETIGIGDDSDYPIADEECIESAHEGIENEERTQDQRQSSIGQVIRQERGDQSTGGTSQQNGRVAIRSQQNQLQQGLIQGDDSDNDECFNADIDEAKNLIEFMNTKKKIMNQSLPYAPNNIQRLNFIQTVNRTNMKMTQQERGSLKALTKNANLQVKPQGLIKSGGLDAPPQLITPQHISFFNYLVDKARNMHEYYRVSMENYRKGILSEFSSLYDRFRYLIIMKKQQIEYSNMILHLKKEKSFLSKMLQNTGEASYQLFNSVDEAPANLTIMNTLLDVAIKLKQESNQTGLTARQVSINHSISAQKGSQTGRSIAKAITSNETMRQQEEGFYDEIEPIAMEDEESNTKYYKDNVHLKLVPDPNNANDDESNIEREVWSNETDFLKENIIYQFGHQLFESSIDYLQEEMNSKNSNILTAFESYQSFFKIRDTLCSNVSTLNNNNQRKNTLGMDSLQKPQGVPLARQNQQRQVNKYIEEGEVSLMTDQSDSRVSPGRQAEHQLPAPANPCSSGLPLMLSKQSFSYENKVAKLQHNQWQEQLLKQNQERSLHAKQLQLRSQAKMEQEDEEKKTQPTLNEVPIQPIKELPTNQSIQRPRLTSLQQSSAATDLLVSQTDIKPIAPFVFVTKSNAIPSSKKTIFGTISHTRQLSECAKKPFSSSSSSQMEAKNKSEMQVLTEKVQNCQNQQKVSSVNEFQKELPHPAVSSENNTIPKNSEVLSIIQQKSLREPVETFASFQHKCHQQSSNPSPPFNFQPNKRSSLHNTTTSLQNKNDIKINDNKPSSRAEQVMQQPYFLTKTTQNDLNKDTEEVHAIQFTDSSSDDSVCSFNLIVPTDTKRWGDTESNKAPILIPITRFQAQQGLNMNSTLQLQPHNNQHISNQPALFSSKTTNSNTRGYL